MTAPTVASLCAALGGHLAPAPGFTAPALEISAVHISELLDPSAYLNGGELLLTTGLTLPKNRIGCERYVGRLKEAGLSALAIGLGPVHRESPPALAAACRKLDLTLLEVPAPTPFLTVTKAYWAALSRSTEQHLNDVLAAHQALVDAAVSPDPVAALLRSLGRALNGWAASLGPAGEVEQVYPLGMVNDAESLRGEIDRLRGAGAHSAATFEVGDLVVIMFPLAIENRVTGYLAVGTAGRLTASQRRMVLTACALLSIDAVRRRRDEPARGAALRCVATLVDMGFTEAARHLAADVQAPRLTAECRVLAVRARSSDEATATVGQWCADVIGVRVDEYRAWFLLPSDHPGLFGLDEALEAFDPTVAALVSDPVRLEDVGAVRVRVTSSLGRCGPGERNLRSVEFDQYGASSVAQRLDALVGEGRPVLVGSLAEYLRHRGQWEQASRALGVHRNTLRHRIGRCRALLALDLDDPDVHAALWLAMRRRGLAGKTAGPVGGDKA